VLSGGLAAAVFVSACGPGKVEVNPIVPAMKVNRARTPVGSALEVTYTWTVEATAKPIPPNHRAFVHVLDDRKNVLFNDDHVPVPPPDQWQPGKTYSYTRTVFVPVVPYVGPATLIMGLYPSTGKGDRIALKAEDIGMRAHKVGTIELLPQTEDTFLIYKEGWYGAETSPQAPGLERMWTKKEALVSFKNPKRDVVVYLEADTNYKAFDQPPMLTVAANGTAGLTVPIESSEVFLKKIRFTADQLGSGEWVDLRLAMNQSFVPKAKGLNQDERELGLLVYHLYVVEAEKLGTPPEGVADAATLPVAPAGKPAPRPLPASSKAKAAGTR
jgi:hypothetical protein